MRRLSVLIAALLVAGCTSSQPDRNGVVQPAAAPAYEPVIITPAEAPAVSRRAYAAIVVDAKTGKVLHEEEAESLRYPASLTKMMTLYLLFEQLDSGRMNTNSALSVSAKAAARPPAKIGVKAGTSITVDTAIRALAVRSANDVAVVISENLAGSEEAYAQAMTSKARSLGMRNTVFVNASGLPDKRQVTTARDMAILGRALSSRFPRYFAYFSTPEFSYGGRKWRNTNKLLGKVDGVNGIKTGYIRDSGFNLVTNVQRGGKHIIAVVIGGRSGSSRNAKMTELIEEYLPEASGGSILSIF
ncbi:D-alanyl-D-alanine carboxypeptidase family protein [Acuticoccus sp. MNP-M23]|uniref:D-alanyl-D-alanine carboxypeptidase family protein n=1 Tax=Acuticoccus sp. MNP-M23 TaxID=3072793 RepID=UPI0028155CB9|nr:D-alanyl-D-alanine carboxypeptidase family protein [Acuticoccus sp. MNP-M23]WMS42841.1 D-alanyl-D-alanine carboxypeptidase family protein [Acuticoccus sp. MNP-M23]